MKQEGATLPIFQGKTGQARNGRGGEAGEETHEPHQSVQHVGGGSVLETHRMSPRAASCFSATWRSWRGSPSSSSRSFSPYRLPSPRVRFVLSQTHRERNKLYTKVQHWTGSEVHTHTHTHQGKEKGRGGREGAGGWALDTCSRGSAPGSQAWLPPEPHREPHAHPHCFAGAGL